MGRARVVGLSRRESAAATGQRLPAAVRCGKRYMPTASPLDQLHKTLGWGKWAGPRDDGRSSWRNDFTPLLVN